ncbi:LysR family transcriptional regulator [Enterococcus saccharolyticus]|uniref:LysR family transcriptional regulator n=1 Tax=Candidatus Enterococcus willemsii TaxID=1857215 RepID=A0ABQ6YX54_9ENTE|nr:MULTISPECIES: LysR family transcriptional regulator [Enterococcus]KAF1302407.1 LysR family transcriptional regulator [Enterococcus sp. CU12B]MCD5002588.1 LysR family transcriptional regulator [Enterococcus saccharolyticus]
MFHVLRTFLSVYETHNFTRTADSLFLSQPTVSAQIKKLEEHLGVTLFIRNGKQEILPTKEADFLYPRFLKIIEEWEDATHHVNTQQHFREHCIFASSQTCGAFLMPKLAPVLVRNFPLIDFSFPIMSSEKIVFSLEKSKISFGLIETPERSNQLDRHLVTTDQLVLAGDLLSDHWILPDSSSPLGSINENYLKVRNLVPHIIRTNNHEMTLSLIKNGLGKTIISKIALDDSIPWEPLELESERNMYFLTRQKIVSEELAVVSTFIQELLQEKNNEFEQPDFS